jgi:hypothetical protein
MRVFMCARIAERTPAGIKLHCAKKFGRITAAGMTKDVLFEPVDNSINDRVDEAYREKYRGSPYLNPMIGARPRSATVKVTPRDPHT